MVLGSSPSGPISRNLLVARRLRQVASSSRHCSTADFGEDIVGRSAGIEIINAVVIDRITGFPQDDPVAHVPLFLARLSRRIEKRGFRALRVLLSDSHVGYGVSFSGVRKAPGENPGMMRSPRVETHIDPPVSTGGFLSVVAARPR